MKTIDMICHAAPSHVQSPAIILRSPPRPAAPSLTRPETPAGKGCPGRLALQFLQPEDSAPGGQPSSLPRALGILKTALWAGAAVLAVLVLGQIH